MNFAQSVPNLNNKYFKATKLQNFSFQQPFIQYLLKNANHNVIQKLHLSCKSMILFKKFVICQRLELSSIISKPFYSASAKTIKLRPEEFESNLPYKIFVTNNFKFIASSNPKALSAIISKHFYRCEAKFINIEDQDLLSSELSFLLSKKLSSLVMMNCGIFHECGRSHLKTWQIHDMLSQVQSYSFLRITNEKYSIDIHGFCCKNCLTRNCRLYGLNEKKEKICNSCFLYFTYIAKRSFTEPKNSWLLY